MGWYSLSFFLAAMQRACAEFFLGKTQNPAPTGNDDKGE
jgi:hypothetical protein